MNYAAIKDFDIANGPGIRVSLFVSGCSHHCPGCFNSETWDYDFGEPYTKDTFLQIMRLLSSEDIDGLTILGGEPLDPQNVHDVAQLIKGLRAANIKKSIWVYTGYTYEELMYRWSRDKDKYTDTQRSDTDAILNFADILVDGRFIEEKKNLRLRFRGSENQRIIDLHKTEPLGVITPPEIVLAEEYMQKK